METWNFNKVPLKLNETEPSLVIVFGTKCFEDDKSKFQKVFFHLVNMVSPWKLFFFSNKMNFGGNF